MTQERLFGSPSAASSTPPAQDPGDYAWTAATAAGEAHAFPPTPEGRLQGRAACGARWTAAYGHDGAGKCLACIVMLRDQLRAIVNALGRAGISTEVQLDRSHIHTSAVVPNDFDAPIGAGESVEASRG